MNEQINFYHSVYPSGQEPPLPSGFVQEYKYNVKLNVYDKQMKSAQWQTEGTAYAANEKEAGILGVWSLSKIWQPRYYKITIAEVKKIED